MDRRSSGNEMKSLRGCLFIFVLAFFVVCCTSKSFAVELKYAHAADDNPLKGLVPYVGASGHAQFPQSLEFRYFPISQLMKGWGKFDWRPIERTLETTGKRGNQLIFRVYLEHPGEGNKVPQFLIDEGLKVTRWDSEDGISFTPDYADPKLRRAMSEFIAALGAKYDGDPRVAFLTVGVLGKWGEWHDYPRTKLFATKEVQAEVMTAFASAFKTTKVLLRYPAGQGDWAYADNSQLAFGYHDDSFAWATLDTGRKDDDWYFVPKIRSLGEGARDKWRRFPIGGEIRPELWKAEFTNTPHPKQQDFAKCVRETHVSWLMDSGLFDVRYPIDAGRKERALSHVRKMGYEFHVSTATLENGKLRLTVENRGVAPFYYDWPVELRYSAPNIRTRPLFPEWKLSALMPGEPATWEIELGASENVDVRVRVPNPMPGGKSLRFANEEMNGEWLEVTFP